MISKWWSDILQSKLILSLVNWSKQYSLPGFGDVSIYEVLRFLYLQYTRDRMVTRANSIAFNLMLAIFPALIFILTLLPHLPLSDDYASLMLNSLQGIMPRSAHQYLSDIVSSIVERTNNELLSIGFLLAIIFSSNGMLSLMTAFDKKERSFTTSRSVIKERVMAVGLTIAIGILFITALLIIVLSNKLLAYIDFKADLPILGKFLFNISKWVLSFLIVYVGVTIVYRYAPKFPQKIKLINPGSIMATILSLLTSIVFSFIINKFGRYNELYGSFGALIVIMIWLQINAFIILAGFELNASILISRFKRATDAKT